MVSAESLCQSVCTEQRAFWSAAGLPPTGMYCPLLCLLFRSEDMSNFSLQGCIAQWFQSSRGGQGSPSGKPLVVLCLVHGFRLGPRETLTGAKRNMETVFSTNSPCMGQEQ